MYKRLLKINGVTIDLGQIAYISDAGHVAMNTYMVSHKVAPSQVDGLIDEWSKWLAFKERK